MKKFILMLCVFSLFASYAYAGCKQTHCDICGKVIYEYYENKDSVWCIDGDYVISWPSQSCPDKAHEITCKKSLTLCDYCYGKYKREFWALLDEPLEQFIVKKKEAESQRIEEQKRLNREVEMNKLFDEISTLTEKVKQLQEKTEDIKD